MPTLRRKKEQDSPAIDRIRESNPFQSNIRDSLQGGRVENSSRMQQLQHLRDSGVMCLPNQPLSGMSYNTNLLNEDHEEHNHVAEPIVTPLSEYLPLQNGSKGEGVRILQHKLNELGASLVEDGAFGTASASAVEIFQVANGLNRTGEVDESTALALFSESPKSLSQAQLEGVPGQFLGSFEAWRGGERLDDVDVVELDGKKVAVKTARAWQILRDAAAADGIHLQLNSGFRTMSEQEHLYQKYGAPRAATPGYSNHQHGQALDIDAANPEHKRWLFENAPSFGWRNTVSFEPWHWEYFGN